MLRDRASSPSLGMLRLERTVRLPASFRLILIDFPSIHVTNDVLDSLISFFLRLQVFFFFWSGSCL